MPTLCPCQSNLKLTECCQPIIQGKQIAKTAEALMRSRYTAYTLGNIAYIRKTQSSTINQNFNTPSVKKWARSAIWKSLTIHGTKQGRQTDTEGWVHFTALYQTTEGKQTIEENSHFQNINGSWQYTGVDGKIRIT